MSEVCHSRAHVKYNLLVVQTGEEGTGDVVECGNVLMCPFYCVHYQVDMLSVHLSCISGDMEIMCTNVSCCWCCIAISWLTLFLILLTSLVVVVSMSQPGASPKKGRRLLFVCLLKGEMHSKVGSLL